MDNGILTGLDYARLIQLITANRHNVVISKLKMRFILFYIYGAYLADNNKPLFTDEKPMAYVSGPTFKNAYTNAKSYEVVTADDFTQDKIAYFNENMEAVKYIANMVDNMYNVTAIELSQMSKRKDTPWDKTIYKRDNDGNIISQNPFGTVIKNSVIKRYFRKRENRIFG